jgi:hypothetical protein
MKPSWLAGLFASILSSLQAQEREEVAIAPLLSSTVTSSGQSIVLPQKDAEVTASIYDNVRHERSLDHQYHLCSLSHAPQGRHLRRGKRTSEWNIQAHDQSGLR